MMKLRPTSKSISRFVVPSVTVNGLSRMILIPFFPADGHMTSGFELSLSVTLDCDGSMISLKLRYVPTGRVATPRFAVFPPARVRRLMLLFGVTRVFHPAESPSKAAAAESVSAVFAWICLMPLDLHDKDVDAFHLAEGERRIRENDIYLS